MIDKIPHDHAGQKSRHCLRCGEFKSPEEFPLYKHNRSVGGYQAFNNCYTCEKQRKFETHLKRTYNLSWDVYTQMVVDQNNCCYLCGSPPTDKFDKLVVDHCHKTDKVRKLLCRMCNVHISKMDACPDYLNRVVEYLKT